MSNPYDFPTEWGTILLSGYDIGLVLSVDGCERPYEWQVQKGKGTKGATSVFNAEGIAESMKVVIGYPTRESFADLHLMRKYIAPQKGQKPPSFVVQNPIFNFNEINQTSIKRIGQPKPASKGSWTVEWEFIEFSPTAPTATGTAKGTQWKQATQASPKDAADAEIDALMKEASNA